MRAASNSTISSAMPAQSGARIRPLRDLVSYVYPALGRLRLRWLAVRRLDPRRNFTRANADEVRRLSRESEVPNAELHATLLNRAETALVAAPGIDYTPLPPGRRGNGDTDAGRRFGDVPERIRRSGEARVVICDLQVA